MVIHQSAHFRQNLFTERDCIDKVISLVQLLMKFTIDGHLQQVLDHFDVLFTIIESVDLEVVVILV